MAAAARTFKAPGFGEAVERLNVLGRPRRQNLWRLRLEIAAGLAH